MNNPMDPINRQTNEEQGKPLVNVIIQCRFSSTRLPGKAMYPLCGIPLLAFLIRRLKTSLPDEMYQIIVATTQGVEDNPVAAWAVHEGVHLIRGPRDDVLSRYIKAMKAFPANLCVRVTADNPLTCPGVLQEAVTLHLEKHADYTITDKFPYGTGVDVFSADLLARLDTLAPDGPDREHINDHVLKHPDAFSIATLPAPTPLCRPELRMTVDTDTDFQRITSILEAAGPFLHTDKAAPWQLPLTRAIHVMDLLGLSENTPHTKKGKPQ